ncbi:hypothetical protein PHYPSEUDO_014970 [Phytophthora pseudosyringae]|uniref:Retrotransposon gag domain-containing protein n=1 Tax=Phytophthora pseudosyringae TaxID=221518 RepID=A0A8T1V3K6_9STRA|nr:hypothetical protein PHYPSEUDO_014970 [Phytophthora pseudosyringae]
MVTAVTRGKRAERRAASLEWTVAAAAAKPKKTDTMMVETDDGGFMMLDTEAIRSAGDTPQGADASTGHDHGGGPGSDGRAERSSSAAGATASGGTGTTGLGMVQAVALRWAMIARRAAATYSYNEWLRRPAAAATQHRWSVSVSSSGNYPTVQGTTTSGGNGDGNPAGAGRNASQGGVGAGHGGAPPRDVAPGRGGRAGRITADRREREGQIAQDHEIRGLYGTMPVTMGVQWREDPLYHEVAAHLDGEALRRFATVMETVAREDENMTTLASMLRRFATVMETVAREDENMTTLASMLRAKYMTRRTTPEVVDLLSGRRQMRGGRLLEYAQSLREIAG